MSDKILNWSCQTAISRRCSLPLLKSPTMATTLDQHYLFKLLLTLNSQSVSVSQDASSQFGITTTVVNKHKIAPTYQSLQQFHQGWKCSCTSVITPQTITCCWYTHANQLCRCCLWSHFCRSTSGSRSSHVVQHSGCKLSPSPTTLSRCTQRSTIVNNNSKSNPLRNPSQTLIITRSTNMPGKND